mmetsp:Transcript_42928/g.86118  ORF Transcript_42928/g.86118 Transcript_42928/m.86118 type:complete len:163 (-) Transcript_42928:110-598(-)
MVTAAFNVSAAPIHSAATSPAKLSHKAPSGLENSNAIEECSIAARYWARSMRQNDLAGCEVAAFENALRQGLLQRCCGHWYPNEPVRGSGHRSIINDFTTDPVLVAAAEAVRIGGIGSRLPRAVMWLNPASVKVKLEGHPYADNVYSGEASSSSSSSDDEDL